jgi:methionine-rich copper-binding protein CopC
MTRKRLLYIGVGLALLVMLARQAPPVGAQPSLREASPAPDAVLPGLPDLVRLVFDHALDDQGTTIRVVDGEGKRVDNKDARVDPANRFEVSATLPPLVDGEYTVEYTATALGGSTMLVGSYTFTINLPGPTLALLTPVDGQAFESGTIPLELGVEFFDFKLFENRIRVYVDRKLRAELRGFDYEIEGLSPGVHEIRVVLARLEDEELDDTAIVVRVAVARHDEVMEGWESARLAEPDHGLQLSLPELVGVVAATILLLAVGIWLGRWGGQAFP